MTERGVQANLDNRVEETAEMGNPVQIDRMSSGGVILSVRDIQVDVSGQELVV